MQWNQTTIYKDLSQLLKIATTLLTVSDMSESDYFISDKTLVLENILKEVSDFKKFQAINYIVICTAIFLTAFSSLSYVFTASNLHYRCEIPMCDKNKSEYNPNWLNNSVPFQNGRPSQCKRYTYNNGYQINISSTEYCSSQYFDNSSLVQCDTFVYETGEKNILNEWNLTCPQNEWKLTMVGTVDILGQFIGLPLLGYFSDRFGRKTVVSYGMMWAGLMGILRSTSHSYIMFLILEFLAPALSAGVYGTAFVLGLELVSPECRLLGGTIITSSFAFGELCLGFIAMMVQNWRWFLRICHAPYFLFVFYLCAVPESIIWMHSKRKYNEVSKAIKKVAAINNVKLSDEALLSLNCYESTATPAELEVKTFFEKEDLRIEEINSPILQIIQSPSLLTRLITSVVIWMINTFVFYGISLYSVVLGGNKYTNFMLISLIEVPGFIACYLLGDKLGRRWTLCGFLLLSGVACVLTPFLDEFYCFKLVSFLVGKFGITASFGTLYIYTAELFPTKTRNSMLGISSTFGRFGHILAQQVSLVAVFFNTQPVLLFGGSAIVAGLLGLTLPETLNKKLPDTIEEAANMDRAIGQSDIN